MKKRKELNALIGLAGDGRRPKAPNKGSGHRLLRTEPPASDSRSRSDSSSDGDDGFGPAAARFRLAKGEYLRCCKFCYPLCAFVILAACVVACVGLVWMQVALKEDLDALKEKFRTMESNQKSSFQEIPKLNEDLLDKQKQLEQIETGDMGLNKIWTNITEINKQILLLTSAVNHLKANIKSAADLINLPVTVEELQKSVATIGSTLTSVHHDVETMQTAIEEHRKNIETLQNNMNEYTKENREKQVSSLSSTVTPRINDRNQTGKCKQDNQFLYTALEEINTTLVVYQKQNDLKFLNVDSAISNLTQRVALLENYLDAVNKLEKRENSSVSSVDDAGTFPKVENEDQSANGTDSDKAQNAKKTETLVSIPENLREKLQLINALTSKPESEKPLEASVNAGKAQTTSNPTDPPRLASRSVGGNMGENGQPRHLSLPGISSTKDLLDLFKKLDQDSDGKLTYDDLQSLVGSAIQELQSFKEFDTDGDEKYSLPELRLALDV
ncbi:EF-hand calcium-binding domain-containing protein 14 isoform X1 [Alligator mississippiensis]|uniref:EF-hand calcium-binding domain-containing protein 14 isoform X1 n=1 Tax=Alligator mississippiensis TaxID=8496 RepID=UPI002877C541|nr:EF-hand calcium-binding domain-containing protein 14 isoform X1 [Alligator mississippiensis]